MQTYQNLFSRLFEEMIHTRLNKLKEGLYDGIVLAQAGLARLGICEGEEFHFYPLDPKHFIPAGGQAFLP